MGQGFDVLLGEELHGLPGNVRPGIVLVEYPALLKFFWPLAAEMAQKGRDNLALVGQVDGLTF